MKTKIIKIIIAIITLILMIGLVIYLLPTTKSLSTAEGQIAFKGKIENAGIGGILIFLAIQIAQIFLFILPGEPLEILAGMCYGPFWGTILIMISVVISSILIYFLVKLFGKKFIYDFASEEQIKKLENSKIFKNAKNIELVLFLMFLIPGTPKDMLIYLGCILPINPIKFILVSTIARFPSIISSTVAGENLAKANFKIAIIAYIITFIIVGLIILIIRIFDKDKTADDIINHISHK